MPLNFHRAEFSGICMDQIQPNLGTCQHWFIPKFRTGNYMGILGKLDRVNGICTFDLILL